MATTKTTYKRAGQFAPGIGGNLDTIANNDVLLVRYSIDERPLNRRKEGDPEPEETPNPTKGRVTELATIVFMTIALNPDKPDETKLFHAWSDDLAGKLAQIPTEELPLLIKFSKVRTGGGYNVWTFE